jgi:hypothetical protein
VLVNNDQQHVMKPARRLRRATVIAAIGLVGAVGASGTAYASTTSPTTAPAAHAAEHHKHRSLLARADRAAVEIKVNGQWVTYTIERGKVSAISPTSITLALPDGQSASEPIGSATKFTGVASASAVTVGKAAVVESTGGAATRISQRATAAAPAS